MELIKRKILLENSIDRTYNSPTYGTITATSFYLKVILTKTFENIGLFTDIGFIKTTDPNSTPDYTILTEKLAIDGITFPFMLGEIPVFPSLTDIDKLILRPDGATPQNYFNFGNMKITGATDSKLEGVKSYNLTNPYQIGFNIGTDRYTGYTGTTINGVNRVVSINNPITYVFDTLVDVNIGTNKQTTGLLYRDYDDKTNLVTINGKKTSVPLTLVTFLGEGWNETNVSLSAIFKEEYLFGITEKPVVQSDVFIDRGAVSVMEKHLVLSEITNLNEMIQYGNGFFNLTNQ